MVKVVVVDDEEFHLKMMADILDDIGLEYELYQSGEYALKTMSKKVDVLITDIGLVTMSGITLMKQAKISRPEMRSIAITGAFLNVDFDGLKRAGFDHVLVRPFSADEIVKAVNNLANNSNISF